MMPGQSWFVRRLGFVPVLGDVYPEDTRNPGVDRIVARVTDRLRAGSIVILHDGSPLSWADRTQTAVATPRILDDARNRGLRSVTLRELLA
jgi:peptidoglycan/xylan/chitin deacetylase (PgdA/CDA1 family)